MKDLLQHSLTQLQNEKSIDANEMCEYIDGKLSSKQSQSFEKALALSPQLRQELSIVREIVSQMAFEKTNIQSKHLWFWQRLPAMAFVLFFTLLIGTLWNAQNQLDYLGLSQQQFKQLPKSLQLSIENMNNGRMPAVLFNNVNSSQEIIRAQINNSIIPQYPLWSRVQNIQQIKWQAAENSQFNVMIIDDNDELVEQFSANLVKSQGNQYWLDLTTTKTCDNCQYAWRVMNTETYEASDFIPFEIKSLTISQQKQLSQLDKGIAKLSFYWQAGYLHQAASQLQYIEDNKNNSPIKNNMQLQLDLHMRKQ